MVRRLFAALIAAAVLTPQLASAAAWKPNLKFGNLELHPYYKLAESYDSNIYLVPKDKPNGIRTGGGVRSSWITDNTLGLKAMFPIGKMHKLSAAYNAQILNYTTQSQANDAFNQTANLTYNYKRPSWDAKFWDTYMNTEDPAFSELVERSQRWENEFGTVMGYAPEGGMLFAEVSAKHANHKYLDSSPGGLGFTLNRYEQEFGIRGGYMIQPKTKAYLGYRRGIVHYSIQPDTKHNKAHYLDAGVEGKIANKLTGRVQTGLSFTKYNNNAVTNAGRPDHVTLWTVATNLNWKPLERTSVDLAASRGLQASTFGKNRYYIANLIGLNASHKLPWKLTAKAGFSAGSDKYPEATTAGGKTANRRDDTYTESVGLEHQCQEWLSMGASYEHKDRNSIFTDQFNYERHLTMLQVKVTF